MTKRICSLDVFRGATVALMILVNNPGSWSSIFPPLRHATWHGVTPTDWVFPFFLFVVGMSIGVVASKMSTKSSSFFWKKVIIRTLIIAALGLLLNYAPFVEWTGNSWELRSFSHLRIMGVLQRIALCYFLSFVLIYYASFRIVASATVALLLLYWFMCAFLGQGDPYSLRGYFGLAWDVAIFSKQHLYQGEGIPFDPEGLASTLGALATTLMGYLVYCACKRVKFSLFPLLAIGSIGVFATFFSTIFWSDFLPLNKKIWTSSYALYMSGLATAVFVVLYLLFDLIRFRKLMFFKQIALFFEDFSKNALFIYVLSGLLVRFLWLFRWEHSCDLHTKGCIRTPWSYLYYDVALPCFSDSRSASLACAILMLATMWLVARVMNSRGWYVKV